MDVERLRAFYRTPLGDAATEMIARRVSALWPNVDGQDVLGFGHSERWLTPYLGRARRVIAASPAAQGVARWPATGRSSSTLVEDDRLPFADSVFDRVMLAHGLEETDSPRRLLRELWRVTAPEGRLLIVVANRSGLWARAEGTPFGHGQPYSRTQLTRLLESALFQPVAWTRALYAPPIQMGFVASAAEAWERAGEIAWPQFGGVLMAEAVKRLYADIDPPRTGLAVSRMPAAASTKPTVRHVDISKVEKES